MKRCSVPAALVASLACSGMATASSTSDRSNNRHVVPVLVKVNQQGRMTSAKTPVSLNPEIAEALHKTVKTMITKPATKNGRRVSSQFILNLAIVPASEENGEYRFSYVSMQAVPSGFWHWAHQGHTGSQELALVSSDQVLISENGGVERLSIRTSMAKLPAPHPGKSDS